MRSSLIDAVLENPDPRADDPVPVTEGERKGLIRALAGVLDPRGRRYPLAAVLAGARTFTTIGDWLVNLDVDARARVGVTGALPVASTLWRVLIRVNADALSACLAGWLHARATPENNTATETDTAGKVAMVRVGRRSRPVLAVDGKSLRGARRRDSGQVHLLAGYDTPPASCSDRSRSGRRPTNSRCSPASATGPPTHVDP